MLTKRGKSIFMKYIKSIVSHRKKGEKNVESANGQPTRPNPGRVFFSLFISLCYSSTKKSIDHYEEYLPIFGHFRFSAIFRTSNTQTHTINEHVISNEQEMKNHISNQLISV